MKIRFKSIKEDYEDTGPVLYVIIIVVAVILLLKWLGSN